MTSRFMMSVAAAALIAGTGFANAQGTGSREGSSAAPAAQQSAPSGDHGNSAAPANRESSEKMAPSSGMKAKQSKADEKMAPNAAKNQRAEDSAQGQKSKSMSSENEDTKGNKEMKAEGRDRDNTMKAEGKDRDRDNTMKAEGKDRDNNRNAETKSDNRSQTTGQAGAGAKLSGDQRTKITTVIRSQHVTPVTSVNFSISVGTRVPRDASFHPLPAEVVTIYPEWRGYEFILVHDQILVIDPQTFEIVAILEA